MMKYKIKIEGMACEHCVKNITAVLEQAGATDISVIIGEAEFNFDGDIESINTAIQDKGFDVV